MNLLLSFVPVTELRVDVLVVSVLEGPLAETPAFAALDGKLGGLLARAAKEEQFKGKRGSQLVLHTNGQVPAGRVVLLGAGARKDVRASDCKSLAARAVRIASGLSAVSAGFVVPPLLGGVSTVRRALEHSGLGGTLGGYRFEKYLGVERQSTARLADLYIVPDSATRSDEPALRTALERGIIVAQATALARDLVNEPPSDLTPRRMADIARDLAGTYKLEVSVLGPTECEKLGMGMFLGVARASAEEPRFIHLAYKPARAQKLVAIIGKGVTFDSGGLSLKTNEGMLWMKVDMAGSATVLAATVALARLGAPVEVHALAACTENMPGGKAYKLGDVLRSMNGKTVEINNTDAEGRLTLGDAITYARQEVKPDEIVDLATLTGACMVALGPTTAGVMGNNEDFTGRWLDAARHAGEEMWGLPLPEGLKEQLKSEIADLRNTGDRYGGALTAGLFLQEFAGDTPWVHVDLAGPATSDRTDGYLTKGGTGFGVATLVEYLAPRE